MIRSVMRPTSLTEVWLPSSRLDEVVNKAAGSLENRSKIEDWWRLLEIDRRCQLIKVDKEERSGRLWSGWQKSSTVAQQSNSSWSQGMMTMLVQLFSRIHGTVKSSTRGELFSFAFPVFWFFSVLSFFKKLKTKKTRRWKIRSRVFKRVKKLKF